MKMNHKNKSNHFHRIGVISDTHGMLHRSVPDLFQPVDRIVHAGDIGQPDVLIELGRIAPITAVRGNMDSGSWTTELPDIEIVELEDLRLCVLHDRDLLDFDPRQAGMAAVISGHTHRPELVTDGGVLFLNPGSASHPRYRHPPTVAILEVIDGRISARLIELGPPV